MTLAAKHCEPCTKKDSLPLSRQEAKQLLSELEGWNLNNDTSVIERQFKFRNFIHSLGFVNQVAEIAERENHHPDITFGWGYCNIALSTHSIGGLHQNDFIVAAKINAIYTG